MKTWVLVAHRAGARIFEYREGHLEHLLTLDHPESRLRDGEIYSDRPGRAFDRTGVARHAMSLEESPHDREAATFARELAGRLDRARANDGLRRIVLVAEPGFLGVIRGVLSDATAAIVDGMVHKDLADVSEWDLPAHLTEALPRVRGPSRAS